METVDDNKTLNIKPPPQLAVIIPAYNEQTALPETAQVMENLLCSMIRCGEIDESSYVCFINDGSRDATWQLIQKFHREYKHCCGINLSRNFGHQAALLAGLFTAKADVCISIDADLQDDEEKMREMISLYRRGVDIVYGCRDNRDSDTWFKRVSAELFYSLRRRFGCNTIHNHADFRLMSKRSIDELKRFSEVNLFLRGVIPMLGFPCACVYYARKARTLGESHYPLNKMFKLAWEGVINFSALPLLCMIWLGGIIFCASILLIFWSIYEWFIGNTLPGWASLFAAFAFFSGLQFLSMGTLGLYISKVFLETKRRPIYILQDTLLLGGRK